MLNKSNHLITFKQGTVFLMFILFFLFMLFFGFPAWAAESLQPVLTLKSTSRAASVPPATFSQGSQPISGAYQPTHVHQAPSRTDTKSAKSVKAPQVISFADDDQIPVILSRVDVNRLSVKGDKITAVDGPTNFYVHHNDASGADFITPVTPLPFTLYFSTEAGHHFSLLVTPKAVVGKTIQFKPTTPSPAAAAWEKASTYSDVLVSLVKGMVQNTPPQGYSVMALPKGKAKSSDVNHRLYMTPVAIYQGGELTGVVFHIQNHTRAPLRLNDTDFYQDNVRAIALSNEMLEPGETGFLYEVRVSGDAA